LPTIIKKAAASRRTSNEMELKNYQEKALYWLGRYYERCRVLAEAGEPTPTSSAFTLTTQEIYKRPGLPYSPNSDGSRVMEFSCR